MQFFNPDLIIHFILPGLVGITLWSAFLALTTGSLIGLIAGVVNKAMKRSMVSSIIGSFIGILITVMLPILSEPGVVNGGGYGGLVMLMITILGLPTGAIAGALISMGMKLDLQNVRHRKNLLYVLLGTYSLIAVITYGRIMTYCLTELWYEPICSPGRMFL